jgi:serralysin
VQKWQRLAQLFNETQPAINQGTLSLGRSAFYQPNYVLKLWRIPMLEQLQNSDSQSLDILTGERSASQTTPTATNQNFINRVLELTNIERSKLGLSPLTLNTQLGNAAETHSQNMALQDFFSHTGKDGSSIGSRITATGYQFSAAAENIGAGYSTPEQVLAGWMNSSGHRANILNPNLKEIGIGYYFLANDTGTENWNHYWT